MTTQTPLDAGEWFNFRGVQSVDILGHTNNIDRLRYTDATEEVVKLANSGQLRTLHEILETRRHPEPPALEANSPGRKAGSWVNLKEVVSSREGPAIPDSDDRLLFLTYSDGVTDDGVIFSRDQAQDVTKQYPPAS